MSLSISPDQNEDSIIKTKLFEDASFAVRGLFPTPLVSALLADHDALNTKLAATILAQEKVERSINASNSGGWHSSEFLSWCGPEGTKILEAAVHMADKMTLSEAQNQILPANINWRVTAWANVNRTGHSNRAHGHPNAYWSGVYWVTNGGTDDASPVGGEFEISDPRGILPAMYAPHLRFAIQDCAHDGNLMTIPPQEGMIILFPSWLIHSVAPYTGRGARISVAFNLSLGDPTQTSPWLKKR